MTFTEINDIGTSRLNIQSYTAGSRILRGQAVKLNTSLSMTVIPCNGEGDDIEGIAVQTTSSGNAISIIKTPSVVSAKINGSCSAGDYLISDGATEEGTLKKSVFSYSRNAKALEPISNAIGKIELIRNSETLGWQRINETYIESAISSITFDGLDGNSVIEYKINTKFKSEAGGIDCRYLIRPNNDNTSAHYGRRYFRSSGASVSTASDSVPGLWMGKNTTSTQCSCGEALFYAKSGCERNLLGTITDQVLGTDVGRVTLCSSIWNNTSPNITSLTILSTQPKGIGKESFIELWERR